MALFQLDHGADRTRVFKIFCLAYANKGSSIDKEVNKFWPDYRRA
jgi:hypothetical protein